MDDATLKFGLLMESAQAHQKMAEAHLDKLREHTNGLDAVVRDEIRRTLIEELQQLSAESQQAGDALRRLGRRAVTRGALWSVAMALASTAIPMAVVRWAIPSESEIASLQSRRDRLAANIAVLEREGGKIDWKRCGDASRLCVRVERKASGYGEHGDYLVIAGY